MMLGLLASIRPARMVMAPLRTARAFAAPLACASTAVTSEYLNGWLDTALARAVRMNPRGGAVAASMALC
jgi:hypothetical protein